MSTPTYGNIGPFPRTLVIELPIRDSRQRVSDLRDDAEMTAENLAMSRLYPIFEIRSTIDHDRRVVRVEVDTEVCDYDEV